MLQINTNRKQHKDLKTNWHFVTNKLTSLKAFNPPLLWPQFPSWSWRHFDSYRPLIPKNNAPYCCLKSLIHNIIDYRIEIRAKLEAQNINSNPAHTTSGQWLHSLGRICIGQLPWQCLLCHIDWIKYDSVFLFLKYFI